MLCGDMLMARYVDISSVTINMIWNNDNNNDNIDIVKIIAIIRDYVVLTMHNHNLLKCPGFLLDKSLVDTVNNRTMAYHPGFVVSNGLLRLLVGF